MYYVFQNKAEAEAKVAEISEGYFTTRPQGGWVTAKYCDVVECVEGFAIPADDVTSQHVSDTPQLITLLTDQ